MEASESGQCERLYRFTFGTTHKQIKSKLQNMEMKKKPNESKNVLSWEEGDN